MLAHVPCSSLPGLFCFKDVAMLILLPGTHFPETLGCLPLLGGGEGFGSNVCTLPMSVKVTLPTWHLQSHDLSFLRDTQPCVITLLVSLFIV